MTAPIDRDLSEFFKPPSWTSGHISLEDAGLLADLAGAGLATPMIEVGVASGWSSAVLLHLLERRPPAVSDGIWLHSYDVGEWCYFDSSRRVGAAVGEVVPALACHWRLHVGNAVDAGLQLRGAGIELAFIDADHRHPWATLDLLALLPALAPGAWVALHDINLPAIATREDWKVYGPMQLFEGWPWEKRVAAGTQRNIGALRVPGDHREVRAFCETVLARPWETSVPATIPAALGLAMRDGYRTESAADRELFAAGIRAKVGLGRPLVLWGAGSAGRMCLQSSADLRALSTAFVDSSPQKQGSLFEGLPVISPTTLAARQPRPFVVITSQFAPAIAANLEALGFAHDDDFIAMEF